MILGPLSPSVLMLIGLTGISYPELLLKCSLPVLIITFITTWFMVHRVQKLTKDTNAYESVPVDDTFTPDKISRRATLVFFLSFISLISFGLYWQADTNYIVVVLLLISLLTGLAANLSIPTITNTFIRGMAGNLHLFVLFIFLDPFINFMAQAGAFKAVTALLMPIVNYGGRVAVPIVGGLTGTVGLTGAAVAVLKMTNDLFGDLVRQYDIHPYVWAVALIVANRATNFIHPGANMFSSMGFAHSTDLVSMIKNGWTIAALQLIFLCVYSFLFV